MANVGVFVDVANLALNGGFGMRYEVLRDFACREGEDALRLNAYLGYDAARAKVDLDYRDKQLGFHSALRDIGFKVIQKEVKWYTDESGARYGKANADLDLAVDALLQSANLDRVLLATGDGDFVQVVRALQNKGCRVEVVAFDNVSADLRREADSYISGYLIPGLLPIERSEGNSNWGKLNGFARGVITSFDRPKGFGWVRYLPKIARHLWRVDTREQDSPFETVFIHDTALPAELKQITLPTRVFLVEFQLLEGSEPGKLKAGNVRSIRART